MRFVLSLISNPAAPALDDAALAMAAGLVDADDDPRWLAPGVAGEIAFEAEPENGRDAVAAVGAALGPRPVDLAVLPAEGRRKRLLVADMDSTMIGQECIDELADLAGCRAEIAAITDRAMHGEIEFEPALRQRVALLRGLPQSALARVLAERIHVNPGAAALVRTMRRDGAMTILVSGGFTDFTGPVAALIGFERHHGNVLLVDNGALTGSLAEPVLGRDAKLAAMSAALAERGLAAADALAVGDGANDLAMIGAAGLGVAYHAKPVVAAAAPVRIDHGDLTALLYLQGYRRAEFA